MPALFQRNAITQMPQLLWIQLLKGHPAKIPVFYRFFQDDLIPISTKPPFA
ncbi:MAG: hypothetical protein ACLP51_19115 [Syntrophobacteraceae bacterium]|jgi:hypothetical protein